MGKYDTKNTNYFTLLRREIRSEKRGYITSELRRRFGKGFLGKCGFCGKKKKYLVIDHNHKTGKVRGILCAKCNAGLGYLGDDEMILGNIINYFAKGDTDIDYYKK
jgi:hypothetical protein